MKQTWFNSAALLLTFAVFGSGCATGPRTHLGNIKNDFLDITRLNAGVGPVGYGADLKATKFLQLKAENYDDVYKAGWIGRGFGVWKEDSKGYAVSTKQIPIKTTTKTATGMTVKENMGFETEYLLGGSQLVSPRWRALMKDHGQTEDDDELDQYAKLMELYSPADELRIALYLGVIGADVGLRPIELLDFALGLLTLGHVDIRGDDHGSAEECSGGDRQVSGHEETSPAISTSDELLPILDGITEGRTSWVDVVGVLRPYSGSSPKGGGLSELSIGSSALLIESLAMHKDQEKTHWNRTVSARVKITNFR